MSNSKAFGGGSGWGSASQVWRRLECRQLEGRLLMCKEQVFRSDCALCRTIQRNRMHILRVLVLFDGACSVAVVLEVPASDRGHSCCAGDKWDRRWNSQDALCGPPHGPQQSVCRVRSCVLCRGAGPLQVSRAKRNFYPLIFRWVDTQKTQHVTEVWTDGVQNYLKHSSALLSEYKDVLETAPGEDCGEYW